MKNQQISKSQKEVLYSLVDKIPRSKFNKVKFLIEYFVKEDKITFEEYLDKVPEEEISKKEKQELIEARDGIGIPFEDLEKELEL